MNKNLFLILSVCLIALFSSCSKSEVADLVIQNARIYTVNNQNPVCSGVAVKNGKILAVGKSSEMEPYIGESTQILNLTGNFVYPGFQEGHAHLMGLGFKKINVDLSQTTSFQEIVEMVKTRAKEMPKGQWIIGRGWHQEKWNSGGELKVKGFPTHHALSEAVPDHPVFLGHASGHAALINTKAMELLALDETVAQPSGGELFKGIDGKLTGILNENALDLVQGEVWEQFNSQRGIALETALKECHKYGITSFHDAGEDSATLASYMYFLQSGKLDLRLNVMISATDTALMTRYFKSGPFKDSLDRLTIQSVKVYSDGALGSRGAWLLEEYTDAPGVYGFSTTPLERIQSIAERSYAAGFQVCTHAIGDRANREILDIYEAILDGDTSRRFRIEHAQHIHPNDIPRFAELGVLPAMQAIHMSSDRPWAIDRLGKARIESGAYVWRSLIDNGSIIINGTDAPVEPVNPLASFYASVSRRTLTGTPENGFEPEQKMTREEALKSYTLWPAYGAFQEDISGSIEVGKYADFVVLDQDIMEIPEMYLLNTQVMMTVFGGKVVFENK